jgi:glutaredoxin
MIECANSPAPARALAIAPRATGDGAAGALTIPFESTQFAQRVALLALAAACVLATPSRGETLYKTIGADGRVEYTDRPPAEGKAAKTLNFADLPATPLPESVLPYREELQRSLKDRLANAGKRTADPQLFTAVWCGYCRKTKSYLAQRGVAYREHDIDTPDGQLAFAQAGNASGIPLLLLGEQRVQGFSAAAYDALLGPLKPSAKPR